MPQLTIVPHGDSAAVVLSKEVLEAIGMRIGDVLEATLSERQLILRRVEDAVRHKVVEEITRDVLERRRDAYQRLA